MTINWVGNNALIEFMGTSVSATITPSYTCCLTWIGSDDRLHRRLIACWDDSDDLHALIRHCLKNCL